MHSPGLGSVQPTSDPLAAARRAARAAVLVVDGGNLGLVEVTWWADSGDHVVFLRSGGSVCQGGSLNPTTVEGIERRPRSADAHGTSETDPLGAQECPCGGQEGPGSERPPTGRRVWPPPSAASLKCEVSRTRGVHRLPLFQKHAGPRIRGDVFRADPERYQRTRLWFSSLPPHNRTHFGTTSPRSPFLGGGAHPKKTLVHRDTLAHGMLLCFEGCITMGRRCCGHCTEGCPPSAALSGQDLEIMRVVAKKKKRGRVR